MKHNLKALQAHTNLATMIPFAPLAKPLLLSQDAYRQVIANEFTLAPHNPSNTNVKAAYGAFARETVGQFNYLLKHDFRYLFTYNDPVNPDTGKPSYAYTKKLFESNGILPVFRTELGEHDLLANDFIDLSTLESGFTIEDATKNFLMVNDIFRAVHDTVGHLASGGNFSELGEQTAYRYHARLYSPLARQALFTETVGQNSYYNTHKTFAPQKCTLLDDRFYGLYN